MSFFSHLTVLVYKNFLLKRRKWTSTLMELVFPLQLVFLLWIFQFILPPVTSVSTQYPTLSTRLCSQPTCRKIAITPQVNPLVQQFQTHFDKSYTTEILVDTKAYLDKYKDYYASVEFITNPTGTNYVFKSDRQGNQTKDIVLEGLLHLQSMSHESLFKMNTKNSSLEIEISTKQFPSKPSPSLQSLIIAYIYPVYFAVSILGIFQTHLLLLVSEKKSKVKSSLRMIGCSMLAYHSSYMIISMIQCIITLLFTTILLYATKMLYWTNFTVFVVFYLGYFLTILPLAQITSCFFQEPKTAGVLSNVVLLLVIASWYLVRFLVFGVPEIPKWIHIFFNFVSPIVFSEFIHQVAIAEKTQIPLTWSNLSSFSSEYNLLFGLIQLMINFVLYTIVMAYFEQIMPGSDEQRQNPFFFLLPSYWCPKRKSQDESNHIEIHQLTKIFTDIWKCQRVVAVDNLSMTISQNEIFALLGHNGAGKTTVISLLTGLLAPSSGNISIHGLSTMESMDTIRSWLGVCPQDSIIFEKLNAYEHLWLFGRIKGITTNILDKTILELFQQVGLPQDCQTGQNVEDFSGGMKRKLSIAMCLIGDPKIIILDEPTTSLDAVSRRKIWKLLQEKKKDRFIILTTHSMEEADLLGDQIAIMKQGKLEACGTSLYLKNHFGVGYTLTCLVETSFDENPVFNKICQIIPDATEKEKRGNEKMYILPYSRVGSFSQLLKMLESQSLGIKNYGLSVTTLEEVFLSI